MTLAPFGGAASGLADGLRVIERLIRLEIAHLRASGVPAGQDEYRGLYISDEEVDAILTGLAGTGPATANARLVEIEAALDMARAELAGLAQAATGPLGRLIQFANLNPFETGCLLLCLAPEANLRFERLFAYVQDDVTKRRPRVELAFRLLSRAGSLDDARQSMSLDAPLRRFQLITLRDEPGQVNTPLPAQYLALDPRIAGFLLGQTLLDGGLRPFADLLPADAPVRLPPLPPELGPRLEQLRALPPTALSNPVLHLVSRGLSEGRAVAQSLAQSAGLALLALDFPGLAAQHGLDLALTLAVREAALQGAALMFQHMQAFKPEQIDRLRLRLEAGPRPALLVLASDGAFSWPGLTIHLPAPDFHGRLALWEQGLGDDARETAEALASKFKLDATQVTDAVETARGYALWRDPRQPLVTRDDLYAAARAQSTPILSSLARKIIPRFTWDDIILPDDTIQHLREMNAYVDHQHVVYKRWGFDRKLALGKGLLALFAGESGTGKTMAADILAGSLGLDLYKIDLSGVVSKYIGETEKNLGRIFTEAESSNAILFFDEADALFGKRSEVRDAHDRYANIETAYLLQKMEEYEGVVILATNLKMNLDEAFMRRMHFAVEFALPEEEDRRRIWDTAIPAEVPLGPDVNLDYLARKFKISGGNIRNIVLAAAFLAASNGQVIMMQHLVQATRREFQKIGRMIHTSDFEGYTQYLQA